MGFSWRAQATIPAWQALADTERDSDGALDRYALSSIGEILSPPPA
jgi:hypothetical protein